MDTHTLWGLPQGPLAIRQTDTLPPHLVNVNGYYKLISFFGGHGNLKCIAG